MRKRILAGAILAVALAFAGCRHDDVYEPRSRTPGVAGEPADAPAPSPQR